MMCTSPIRMGSVTAVTIASYTKPVCNGQSQGRHFNLGLPYIGPKGSRLAASTYCAGARHAQQHNTLVLKGSRMGNKADVLEQVSPLHNAL